MKPKYHDDRFAVLSTKLVGEIGRALAESGRVFAFAARRGLSGTTLCQDCGTAVACASCGTPAVLHGASDAPKPVRSASGDGSGNPPQQPVPARYNEFRCHLCGERRSALETCVSCGGWRLVSLGIGVERAADELAKAFPDAPLFRIDSDSATPAKARKTAAEFAAATGGILVGTEMAIPLLPAIALGAVVSLDSLLSVPDFRIEERVFSALSRIADRTSEGEGKFVIQTRDPEAAAVRFFAASDTEGFFKHTLEERRRFSLPPYGLRISIEAPLRDAAEAASRLAAWSPLPLSARTPKPSKTFLIRLPEGAWPEPALLAALRSLPPSCDIEVDA